MGNYQGKATGNYTWGVFNNGTEYVAVDIELFKDNGERHGVITHRFSFKEGSQKNIEISIEGLKLLGARMLDGDPTDLFGLGSKTAGIVTKDGQYGEEVAYVNPPGPRARKIKDEEKLDQGRLAAFRARMMPVVAGIAAQSGNVPGGAPAPRQAAQRPAAPAGAQPWNTQAAPAPQQFSPPPVPGANDADDRIPF